MVSIPPKANYEFSAILIKLPMAFYIQLEQKKIVRKYKRPRIAKIILRKKTGPGGIMLPDFILYSKAIVIMYYGTGTKNRNIDQWNRC